MHETKWDTFLSESELGALRKTFFLFTTKFEQGNGNAAVYARGSVEPRVETWFSSFTRVDACTRCSPVFSDVTNMQP